MQTQLAIELPLGKWALINASPDLRFQLEAAPELQPREGRSSPISDVILTGADVDQIHGLLLLREFHTFRVHATAAVRRILCEHNILFRVLSRFAGQVQWHDLRPSETFKIGDVTFEPLPLSDHFPGYVPENVAHELNPGEASLGLIISAARSRVAFFPACGQVTDRLLDKLDTCDAILFDGTFWSDDEPRQIHGLGRSARDLGHIPISGTDGSLQKLARLTRPKKYFIHVNNTNPVLDPASDAHKQLRDSGWQLAEDAMEIRL